MHHFWVYNAYLNISLPHLPYAHNCEIRFGCYCRRVRQFLFQNKPHYPGKWDHFLDQSTHWTIPGLFTQGWYKELRTCTWIKTEFCTWAEGCSKLRANHLSITYSPVVITHCSPLVINANLNTSLVLIGPSHQSNFTILTWNCIKQD